MALPTTRNKTYTNVSPVDPNDLNDFQDQVVGMKFKKHWRWYPFPRGVRETGIVYSNSGGAFAGCIRASGAGPYQYDGPLMLSLPEGTLIDGFKIRVVGTAGGGNVQSSLSTNLQSGIATINAANPGAGVETTFTVDPIGIPRVLAVNEVLSITALLPAVDVTLVCFALQLSRL